MTIEETLAGLRTFSGRGAGTDAERRAARWLAGQLRAEGYSARLQTFWCRPNWALAQAWHVGLGLTGSLVSVGSPRVGGGLILAALVCMIADAQLGRSPGRWLTPLRASQNVIAGSRRPAQRPVTLVITANLDQDRESLLTGNLARRVRDRVHHLSRGRGPGWIGWVAVLMAWALATAVARAQGDNGAVIGVLQLLPTVTLVLVGALLIDHGVSAFGPAGGDNATGVATAAALAGALAAGPPANLEVELVLQGAGTSGAIGLRRYIRSRRLRPSDAVVLGVRRCGAGAPRWWVSEGQLVGLRHFPALRRLAAGVAAQAPRIGAAPTRSRDSSPAPPTVVRRIPALALGAAGTPAAGATDGARRTVQFGLLLIDAVDGHVAQLRSRPQRRPRRERSPTPA